MLVLGILGVGAVLVTVAVAEVRDYRKYIEATRIKKKEEVEASKNQPPSAG